MQNVSGARRVPAAVTLSQRFFRFGARFDFGLVFGLTVDFVFGFVVLAFAADFLVNFTLGLGLGLALSWAWSWP